MPDHAQEEGMAQLSTDDPILTRRESRAGRITLNRPEVINALDLAMVRTMTAALNEWRDEAAVEFVILDGAGTRGLCAGGDVKAITAVPEGRAERGRTFWREEYTLIAMIAHYPKPIVALMDGIVMGGGIGISAHTSHRIVTERSRLAMPETAIGLIPDVGATWLLARAPGHSGVYLGLTGTPMNAADAIYAGFADRMVPSERLAGLIERLCNPYAGSIERVLAVSTMPAGASALASRAGEIAASFGHSSLERIMAALTEHGSDWSRSVRAGLEGRSPLCLKTTLAAIRAARTMQTLEEALDMEYRITTRLLEHGEFVEGARARLIEKDNKPTWRPASLPEVTDDMVAMLMAPLLPGEELGLKARA